jgi:IS5 family transposase
MASLLYLKHTDKLSDEELVERWAENVVWQYFSGMTFYEPRLPCDATQIGRFRTAIGEAGMEELLKAGIDAAAAAKAIKPVEFERVIVDTTVQEKAIAHPVDSRLLEIARHKAGGYGHAKQFKRLKKVLKRQRTTLGIVLREVQRKITQAPKMLQRAPSRLLWIWGFGAWMRITRASRSSIGASSRALAGSSSVGSSAARRWNRPLGT